MTSESPVRAARNGAVLEVVLDRPKANAIDAATSRIMGDTFAGFRDDPDLRVAILTGGGEKFFCPGWDLKATAAGEAPDSDYGVGGFGGLQALPGLNKPVICAVNGIAFGGGFELALSGDIIIAADHAEFALPEIDSGTIADAATLKLPRRIPYHIALEMLFTGRRMSADEAARWGLVNHVVPAADLMAKASEIAELLAAGPPLVHAAIKEVLRETEGEPFQPALQKNHQAAAVDRRPVIWQRGPTRRGAGIHRETQTRVDGPLTHRQGARRQSTRTDFARNEANQAGSRRGRMVRWPYPPISRIAKPLADGLMHDGEDKVRRLPWTVWRASPTRPGLAQFSDRLSTRQWATGRLTLFSPSGMRLGGHAREAHAIALRPAGRETSGCL